MTTNDPRSMRRVMALVEADGGDRVMRWARELAAGSNARLLLVSILPPGVASDPGADATRIALAKDELASRAGRLIDGTEGRAVDVRVLVEPDPARAAVELAEREGVDVLLVDNRGMRERREFLAGNVANRIVHAARCTVILVDGEPSARPGAGSSSGAAASPAPTTSPDPGGTAESGGWLSVRSGRIAMVFARHGLSELLGRPDAEGAVGAARTAKRLREALEELGPTFAKLGQLLSTRPDLLPPEYIAELAGLQDRVPALPESDVLAVLEQELGVPWEDAFASLEPQPLAAGTIAQVHRATLASGERVVVKVQRPTARKEIEQDLALLELFAEKAAGRRGLNQVVDVGAVFEHLSTSLQRELDFRQEAGHMERLREVLVGFDRLRVPEVRPELSTTRVLIMEEIPGVAVAAAEEEGARRVAARQLLEGYYKQILVDGFFHADPHPGNLRWWNERIYFLDCGMVGEVSAETRRQLVLLLLAFWQGDAAFLTEVVLGLAGDAQPAGLDVRALQDDVGAVMNRYRSASLREIQLGPVLQEVTSISVRQGIRLPASLALAGKALSQMQLVAAELDPTLDPIEVAGRFLMRNTLRGAAGRLDPRLLYYQGRRWQVRFTRMAEALERLVGARPGEKLEVSFRADRLERAVRSAGRQLTLGLVAASALLGAAFTSISDRAAWWLPEAFGAVGAIFVAWLTIDLLRRRD